MNVWIVLKQLYTFQYLLSVCFFFCKKQFKKCTLHIFKNNLLYYIIVPGSAHKMNLMLRMFYLRRFKKPTKLSQHYNKGTRACNHQRSGLSHGNHAYPDIRVCVQVRAEVLVRRRREMVHLWLDLMPKSVPIPPLLIKTCREYLN